MGGRLAAVYRATPREVAGAAKARWDRLGPIETELLHNDISVTASVALVKDHEVFRLSAGGACVRRQMSG